MDNLQEKKLSSKQVFDGCLLKIYSDQVELPNGRTAVREVVRHPGAVAIVPILPDGRIVMVRQFRYPLGGTMLEIPAGKLDPGENPEQCARRELSEETGYSVKRLHKLVSIHTTAGFTDEVIHVYSAQDLAQAAQHPDEDEFVNIEIYTREQLRGMVDDGRITDAKTIVGLFMTGLS